jgi:hypothetical protein
MERNRQRPAKIQRRAKARLGNQITLCWLLPSSSPAGICQKTCYFQHTFPYHSIGVIFYIAHCTRQHVRCSGEERRLSRWQDRERALSCLTRRARSPDYIGGTIQAIPVKVGLATHVYTIVTPATRDIDRLSGSSSSNSNAMARNEGRNTVCPKAENSPSGVRSD